MHCVHKKGKGDALVALAAKGNYAANAIFTIRRRAADAVLNICGDRLIACHGAERIYIFKNKNAPRASSSRQTKSLYKSLLVRFADCNRALHVQRALFGSNFLRLMIAIANRLKVQ